MQIPKNAETKLFDQAALGSLLVGRFGHNAHNFIAIRTEFQEGTGDSTPYLAVLSSWVDDQDFPYLCDPAVETPIVLDLGPDWSFDVPVDENLPAFRIGPDTILIRCGAEYFIRLKDGLYLNTSTGIADKIPSGLKNIAAWSAFDICLPQSGVDGPASKIFSWPRNKIPPPP